MSALLRLVFEEQRKTGRLDLEAVEMALRAAMHRAGAAALTQLLRLEPPDADHREVPGQQESRLANRIAGRISWNRPARVDRVMETTRHQAPILTYSSDDRDDRRGSS